MSELVRQAARRRPPRSWSSSAARVVDPSHGTDEERDIAVRGRAHRGGIGGAARRGAHRRARPRGGPGLLRPPRPPPRAGRSAARRRSRAARGRRRRAGSARSARCRTPNPRSTTRNAISSVLERGARCGVPGAGRRRGDGGPRRGADRPTSTRRRQRGSWRCRTTAHRWPRVRLTRGRCSPPPPAWTAADRARRGRGAGEPGA